MAGYETENGGFSLPFSPPRAWRGLSKAEQDEVMSHVQHELNQTSGLKKVVVAAYANISPEIRSKLSKKDLVETLRAGQYMDALRESQR